MAASIKNSYFLNLLLAALIAGTGFSTPIGANDALHLSETASLHESAELGSETNEAGNVSEDEVKEVTAQDIILQKIESDKIRLETEGLRAVQWVDSFFSDPSYEAEVVTSQFRLRPEISYRSEQGFDTDLKASFKFSLPNFDRKVSLIGGAFDTDAQAEDVDYEAEQERTIGLQFFGKERKKWNTSFSAGIKDNDWAALLGPRFRYRTTLGERGSFLFTQRILWQTNNEWQFKTNTNLSFAIDDRYFFRQTIAAKWRGEYVDEEGLRTQVSSVLTRRFQNEAGLQSEFTMLFGSVPDTHVIKYLAALRYRKRTW